MVYLRYFQESTQPATNLESVFVNVFILSWTTRAQWICTTNLTVQICFSPWLPFGSGLLFKNKQVLCIDSISQYQLTLHHVGAPNFWDKPSNPRSNPCKPSTGIGETPHSSLKQPNNKTCVNMCGVWCWQQVGVVSMRANNQCIQIWTATTGLVIKSPIQAACHSTGYILVSL